MRTRTASRGPILKIPPAKESKPQISSRPFARPTPPRTGPQPNTKKTRTSFMPARLPAKDSSSCRSASIDRRSSSPGQHPQQRRPADLRSNGIGHSCRAAPCTAPASTCSFSNSMKSKNRFFSSPSIRRSSLSQRKRLSPAMQHGRSSPSKTKTSWNRQRAHSTSGAAPSPRKRWSSERSPSSIAGASNPPFHSLVRKNGISGVRAK